jgi:hypothetical protein
MRHASVWLIVGVMLLWAGVAGAAEHNLNNLLHGDYAFTGTGSCLSTLDGFNPDLTPIPSTTGGPWTGSWSVQGVATFNGDGTGTRHGRDVSITHVDRPYFAGNASSEDWETAFTYTVTSPTTFTTELSGLLTGTFLTGSRVGQTYTVDRIPLTGMISHDKNTLTLATDEPTVETKKFSTGEVHYEICHRSRVYFRLQKGQ